MPVYESGVDISATALSPRRSKTFRKFQTAKYKGNYRRSKNSPDGFEIILRDEDISSDIIPPPLQIVQAKIDRQCATCPAREGRHGVDFGRWGEAVNPQRAFDLGRESGRIFGALCHDCGWSF